jgi:probable F420-dependent oxidoreductase
VTPLAIPVDAQLSGETPQEIVAFAVAAEAAGFARLWAPELTRSATIPLALAAASTSRIELATGIALAFTRSPFTLALEMLDLDELSGGRMALGLGAGVKRLNERWHGVAYDPPIRRMRETVAAVRELIRTMPEEGPSRAQGRIVDIEVSGYERPFRAPRTAIPVWLAAVMPGMAGLCGEISDGFIDHPVTTPQWLDERLLPQIRAGAERAGREAPQIAAALICAVSADDPDAARRAAACTVGFYATVKTYAELFAGHGFGERIAPIRKAFLTRDPERLAEAVGEDMTAIFAAAGTPDEVRERACVYETRADRLWVTPPHHLQSPADSARWQLGILEAFGH